MTEFGDFLINNLKQNLEPEDLQILTSAHTNCHTIKEEASDGGTLNLRVPKSNKIDYARKWAENVNNYCATTATAAVIDYNNVVIENETQKANTNYDDDYVDHVVNKKLGCAAATFKEMRCSFNKIEQQQHGDVDFTAAAEGMYAYDASAGKIIKRKLLIQKKINENAKDRTFNDSLLNVKIRPTLPEAGGGKTTPTAAVAGTRRQSKNFDEAARMTSSSQKITANPVYESEIIRSRITNNEVNNYDAVVDNDNEKMYHELLDIDSKLSKLNINGDSTKKTDSAGRGFFKAFKALMFNNKKKRGGVEFRNSMRKSMGNKKKQRKQKSYDLSQAGEAVEDKDKAADSKNEKKLEKKREKEAKKLVKENLKQIKANKKKMKKSKKSSSNSSDGAAADDDYDVESNCYRDPSQIASTIRQNPAESSTVPGSTLKKCQLKSREKMLFSWDKVVKKASKDPSSLKKLLQEQSDKAIDDYKKRKSQCNGKASPTSKSNGSESESGGGQATRAKSDDSDDLDIPINQLLSGGGKQGELIRSLFSYLNQYGDDGFTIRPPGMKTGVTRATSNHPRQSKSVNKAKEEKPAKSAPTPTSANKLPKSSVPYYLKCCLEVQPPGPGSTIGSRRIIFEEGVLQNACSSTTGDSNGSSLFASKKKRSTCAGSSDTATTDELRQAFQQLSTKLNKNLDEKALDKFIEELDDGGKAEVLKRKLSMYLKMKKSSQSNMSDQSATATAAACGQNKNSEPKKDELTQKRDESSEAAEVGVPETADQLIELDFVQKIESPVEKERPAAHTKERPPKEVSQQTLARANHKKSSHDTDIEMFYFSTEGQQNKTLMKTRKIFRGFAKQFTASDTEAENLKVQQQQQQITKANQDTRDASHHYQHQNIFKTLLKSKKNTTRQRQPSGDEGLPLRTPQVPNDKPACSSEAQVKQQSVKVATEPANNKKPTRLEKLINELSTPEAIQAMRSRYDTDETEDAHRTTDKTPSTVQKLPKTKAKEKFHGHMKELVSVLNEKFGAVAAASPASANVSRSNTQRGQARKPSITTKNKIFNSSSRYNSKRGSITGTKKKSTTGKKKRRSTRIGWRPVVGNQPRSTRELLKEISVIAKSDVNLLKEGAVTGAALSCEDDIKEVSE